jgi:hypothetical protein
MRGRSLYSDFRKKMDARRLFGRKIVRNPYGSKRDGETGEQQHIRR